MEVYQASDGGVLQLDKGLSDYDSIESIVSEIAMLADVAPENALLFLDDGRELRQSVLEEQWERGGKGSQSTPPRAVLYLYNRETFWTDPERWAVQFQEDVQLPPPLDLTTADELAAAQEPFIVAFDHVSHLESLFQAQHRALQIAYANLAHHLAPISREFQSFSQRAQADLAKEEALLRSTDLDMALLPKVVIHEAFLRKRNKANEDPPLDKSERKERKTMADFVKKPKMEQVQESCKKNHEDHVARFEQISGFIVDLQTESDQARQESELRATEVAEEFLHGLARIQETLARIEHLLASPMGDVEQDLIELDSAMRDDLIALTGVKNGFTHDVHLHLRKVAVFQSRIAEIVQPLIILDGDLKSKSGFPHLTRLHQLPFAYAAAVVEVVRRKEFAEFLGQWAALLGETLGRLVHKERTRRKAVKQEVLDSLPWIVPALEESMTPVADLRFNGGADSLQVWELGRAQIDDLLTFAEGLRNDPEVAGLIAEAGEDPTTFLQQGILALRAEMDTVKGDLGNEVDISVKQGLEDMRNGGSNGTTQTIAHADHQRILQTLQDDYSRQMAEVEQRERALQMRQGELQDELVRLRTDLADEMLARQTLSAELEERAQQHQDDQTDLTVALQAEMAQEKDRAQDLGVRLQEALLDIDGLRNAEQTLLSQLQAMQEDRTRNLQTLSEVQSTSRGFESQLAGLRAELEATSKQLSDARQERDVALRNQSAEAEKLMRDHIAEADGDRAVLEHQNLTLSKQLEDLKREMEEKLSAARNTSTRQLDGLRAELQFTKAQLKEAQRRETVLVDELAIAKDNATVITQENNHQSDVSRDAVLLARKYHETCQRLLTAINASSTVSGAASTIIARPKTPPSGVPSLSEDMRESVLVKSLAPASSFDLVAFSEAVMKSINVARKYLKSYKQYRDVARNKLSFNTFTKGDLALFLPTRNAANKPWAAFNQSAPHNFLNVTQSIREQLSGREWWIARVVKTDEAVATGDSPETNPFGLAEGIRYYVHTVEEYDPRTVRLPRRATMDGSSKARNTSPAIPGGADATGTSPSRPTKPRRTVSEMVTSPPIGDESSPSDGQDDPAPPPIRTDGNGSSGDAQLSGNDLISVPVPVTARAPGAPETVPSPVREPSKLSTVLEGSGPNASLVSVPPPAPPRNALSPKPEAIPRNISATRLPRIPSDSRMPSSRPFSATPPRDAPLFQPSSYGRSVSISSSISGNALTSHALGKATPAPAMATTNSNSDTEPVFPQARKRSSVGSIPSGFSPGSLEADHRPSPLRSGGVLPLPSSTGVSPSERSAGSGSASPGGGATEFTPGQSPGQGALTAASKLIRGFSMRKRTSSGLTGAPGDNKDGKERPSAMDILKRFEAGGSG